MPADLVVPGDGAAAQATPSAPDYPSQGASVAPPSPAADATPPPEPAPPAPQPDGEPNPYVAIGQSMADERKAANPYVAIGESYANARHAALQSSLTAASETNADRQARVLALASKTSLPPSVVDRNLDLVAARTKLNGVDVGQLLTQHPELSGWLSKPENASVAQDDLPVLQTLDHAMRALTDPQSDPTGILPPGFIFDRSGQIIEPDGQGNATTIGGIDSLRQVLDQRDERAWLEHVDRLTRVEIMQRQYVADGAVTQVGAGALGSATGSLLLNALRLAGVQGEDEDAALQALQSAAAQQTPSGYGIPGALGRGVVGLAVDTPLMLAGGALGKLIPGTTRLARAAQTVATFAPVNAANFIESTRVHGLGYGATSLLINSLVPAAFPLATGHLGGAAAVLANEETAATAAAGGWSAAAGRFLSEIGVQSGQMQAIEAANALHEYASGVDPNALRVDRLVPRLITAGLLGAGQAGVLHLPVAIGEKFHRDVAAAISADSYAQRLASAVDVVRASKLQERSPEAMASLLQQLGGPDRRVFLQTSDFDAAAIKAGQDPLAAAEAAGLGAAYREAKATGGEMAMPVETFLQTAAGEGGDALISKARQAPGAMTGEEAGAFKTSLPQTVDALRAEVAKAADLSRDEPTQAVHDDLVQQLVAAGTEKASASRQATILAKGFRTLAERMNAGRPDGEAPLTAKDLYDQYRLTISRADNGTSEARLVLDQAAYHGSPHEFDRFTTAKMGTGEGAQAFGWGLYFAGKKEVAQFYREKLAGVTVDGEAIAPGDPRFTAAKLLAATAGDLKEALSRATAALERGDRRDELIAQLKELSKKGVKPGGRLYTAEIPEDHQFLLWDKPLSEQPAAVRAALRAIPPDTQLGKIVSTLLDGKPTRHGRTEYDGREIYEIVADEIGAGGVRAGSEEASRALHAAGIAGIKFRDQQSRGAAAGTHNYVVFDENAVKVTRFEQTQGDNRRGQITFGADRRVAISLFEQKDLSTFLHEGGHLFLEVYGDLAAHERAPEQIRQDYAKILEWLGVKDRASIGRDQHEQFARGFETYLMEGKAPSLDLRATFARVKQWFKDLYGKLSVLGADLSDEVRGVFDRLLATDDEIAAAERVAGAKPLFATAADARMTPEQFAAYRASAEKAHATAVADLEQQLLAEERKAQSETYKRRKAETRAEVERVLDQQPAFAALRALQDGELPGGEPIAEGVKLDRADLVARYGEAGLKALPGPGKTKTNRGRHVYAVEGGITLDQAAELFGFPTGDDLYRALAAAPNREREIARQTAERMRELYPDSRTDGSAVEKAQAAVENEHRSDVLAAELKALRQRQREAAPAVREAAKRATAAEKQRGDNRVADVLATADAELAYERALGKARVDTVKAEQRASDAADRAARDQALESIPPVELLRAVAKEAIAAKRVADLNPNGYLVAARKASREALRAAAAGDWARAADAKQQELLAHELYRAARDTAQAIDKGIAHLRGLQKATARERIGKAGGWEWVVTKPDGTSEVFGTDAEAERAATNNPGSTFERTSGYLEQLDALLDRFDLRPASALALRRRELLATWIEGQRQQEMVVDDSLLALADEAQRKNWQQLTVDEFHGLVDAAKNIEAMARLKNKLLHEKDQRSLEERAQQMVATIEENSRGARARKVGRSLLDKPAEWFGFALASLRKMTSLLREMDGHRDGGVLHELVTRQLNEATDAETVARREAAVAYAKLAKAWGKMGPSAAIRRLVPGVSARMSLEARIAVALNWGNAGNRTRLIKEANGLSEGEIRSVLDSLDEKDWRFVQGVLDHVNSYWPRIAAKQQRVTGVAPEKVEALPIETRFGTFKGGYYPVAYDSRLSAKSHGLLVEEQANLMKAGGYTAATTRRGHTKARAEEGTGSPLRLDLGVIPEHIARVVHDLSFHETLIDVNRLFRRKEVEAAIRSHYGDRAFGLIQASLEDSAAGEVFSQDALEKGINWLAGGSSAATMGVNLQVALMNVTGFTQSLSRVGPVYFAKALGRVIRDAAGWRNAGTWIDAQSPYMRERQRIHLRDAAEVNRQMNLTGKLDPVRASFHYFVVKMDRAVAIPTWIASYEKAMAEHGDEEKAIATADSTVRETQGSNAVHDLASVQRGHPLKRLFTQFYHYMSTTYQLTAESVNRFRGGVEAPVSLPAIGRDVAATARLASDVLCLYVLPAAIAAGIRTVLHPHHKPEDDYGTEVKREVAGMFLGTLPLVRDFAATALAGSDYKGPTGTRGLEQIGDLVARLHGEYVKPQKDHHIDRAFFSALGVVLHLPTVQVQRTVDGFVYLQEHGGSPAVLIGGKPPKR